MQESKPEERGVCALGLDLAVPLLVVFLLLPVGEEGGQGIHICAVHCWAQAPWRSGACVCSSRYWEGGESGPALVQRANKLEEVRQEGGGESREEGGGRRSLWQSSINVNARVLQSQQSIYCTN